MNGHRARLGGVMLTLLLLSVLPRAALAAGTLYVDDTGTASPSRSGRCGNPNYATIQAAVDVAAAGTKIVICAGTYVEQVTVDGKSLKLEGRTGATVVAPAALAAPGAIIHFLGAQRSILKSLTIRTSALDASGTLRSGVHVSGGARVSISRNQLSDIRSTTPDPLFSCGSAILVGEQSMAAEDGVCDGVAVAPGVAAGSFADITDNRIERYGNVGVEVNGVGAAAMIDDNQITGLASADTDEQFGIQIAHDAQADAEDNTITGNQSFQDPEDIDAAGVYVLEAGTVGPAGGAVTGVSIRDNTIAGNTEGIFVRFSDGVVVRSNDISGSRRSGIFTVGTTGVLIVENKTIANGFDGIRVVGGSGNTLRDNRANGNVNGIEFDEEPANNFVRSNTTNNNSGNGIALDSGSAGNLLQNNHATGNGEFDARDGNGDLVSNTWQGNECTTDSPDGLCED